MTTTYTLQSFIDQHKSLSNWYPACGGLETVFTSRTGRRLLYVWQPSTGDHAYLDVNTDIILSNEEAFAALGVN